MWASALVLACVWWTCGAGPGPPGPPGPSGDSGPDGSGPVLRFPHALYNLTIPENSPPRTRAEQPPATPPAGLPLPAPDAHVRFRIRHGDKEKFFKAEERTVGDFCFLFVRTRAGHAGVLNRERRDSYRLEVRATAQLADGTQLEADTTLLVTVTDVNDLSPLFYPTDYDVTVPEDAPVHSSVISVTADDADIGINGEIYYSIAEPTDQFAIHPTTGAITLTRKLSVMQSTRHVLTVSAQDRASLLEKGEDAPAARATVVVNVAQVNLHAPEFHVHHLPEVAENSTAEVYAIIDVTDQDAGEHGRIASLEIVDGDPDGVFRVRSPSVGRYEVVAHALAAAGSQPRGWNLTLVARDAGAPPRAAYLPLRARGGPGARPPPVFSRARYDASLPETAPPGTPIIRLKVSERDEDLNARVYIEIVGGNEGGEFIVNPDTGVLYTAVPLDAEIKSLYTLTVSAIDQGNTGVRLQSSAKVQVTVVDANDNDPVFTKSEIDVDLPENGPSGAVVAKLTARDADSGENAYISYSIANLQPVPFDVDHFSGAVRTTKILDYESMQREYVLHIRASDWGVPYRRQAEARLTVRLKDVNDNRPQFERVDCVGYVSRRTTAGAELATLSALDFDAGDVVSYRIVSGNEDNCFILDSSTGVLSLTCDLADIRADTRVLNVTATDGTHFADPTSLTLHLVSGGTGDGGLECRDTGIARRLIDLLAAAERSNAPVDTTDEFPLAPTRYGENLHLPEFIDFPVEVKVNESVALGTSLVQLRARDRDLGYNGLLVFAVSGGDPDSAFRIDPDTGELKVIGYLDRERESEYYLNVTVYDLGKPQRSVSRLLPVTILDVNDNKPKFQKSLASFRVTENALNGTAIFRANATDRDSGDFARITYSLSGGDGEFCVDKESGVLSVCATLDRERRALYELSVRATDGGGLTSSALVRVAVDDINDNAPRFGLTSYNVRVREDVPKGTMISVIEAFDPDLDAGGIVTYSLPDQAPEDAVFTIDSTSGTLRTAKRLDFEDRQVYGVTVRAMDGGQPALYSEVSVIVEVEDVDENRFAPVFANPVLWGHVREDAPIGAPVLAAEATDHDPPGRDSKLSYYIVGGSGMAHFTIDDAGMIRTSMPLDRETVPFYWLTVAAEDQGLVPRYTTVEVYIEVQNVNDMVPWPEQASYSARVSEAARGGTSVVKVTAIDLDDAPSNITYSIVAGNPDGLFSIDEHTGEIVTTGRILDRESSPSLALEVRCSDGDLWSTARVSIQLVDENDHAPAFTHTLYDFRIPAPSPAANELASLHEPQGDAASGDEESSTEWDDEDDARGQAAWDHYEEQEFQGTYVGTVLALDPDAGINGSVWYSARARGPARGLLRVQRRTGRITAHPSLPLTEHHSYQLTIRACDSSPTPRCGWSRAAVRGGARAGPAPPSLAPPPALAVAELDPPGFLLAVLQATDPDGDVLYYQIEDGDPRQEFYIGRSDGSLVLARRLLWERQAFYSLNVSVSDGLNVVTTLVNITVVNDANEGGVWFSRSEYTVQVSESARVGEALAALRATVRPPPACLTSPTCSSEECPSSCPERPEVKSASRLLYGIHAARSPASLKLFRLHEFTGVLELAQPLDRETASSHELTVWARDQAPRAARSLARLTLHVHDADDHPPTFHRKLAEARISRTAPAGSVVTSVRAADPDAAAQPLRYELAGGDAQGLFEIEPVLGELRLRRTVPMSGPRSYTVFVRAAPAPAPALPVHVTVTEPDDAAPRITESTMEWSVYEDAPLGTVVGVVQSAGGAGVRLAAAGAGGAGGGLRLDPVNGALLVAGRLDYETENLYNITVTAYNMGGGSATATIIVHILDRNEFPPLFIKESYQGQISEAAPIGSLVIDDSPNAEKGAPLVLDTEDGDSPANQQKAYEILEPEAAARFHIDPTTGALKLAKQLDFEEMEVHEFTVKVIDKGTPHISSWSTSRVTIRVRDVNDCAPRLPGSVTSELRRPAAKGLAVVAVKAVDPDLPPGGSISYDIIEGDPAKAFKITSGGVILVEKADNLQDSYQLRIRASDGQFSSTSRVKVSVKDTEAAGLAFLKARYWAAAVENSTKPATLVVLSVLGAALNEHIEFTILNPVEGFEIGLTSGAVRTTGVPLDREAISSYSLLVQARAGGRLARCVVEVSVSDVNDNCPVFVGRPYEAAVRAGAPPATEVLRVRAIDADDNDNGEVRYEMKRGHGELFRVDRRTGVVSLKQTLDAHNQLYTLVIAAFDGGVPACGSSAPVSVRVWRGGAAPAWPAPRLTRSGKESLSPGSQLTPPLTADSPLQRSLIYTLHGDEDTKKLFDIHFDTASGGNNQCILTLRAPLDYETSTSHELTIRATDGVTGASADAALTIDVEDVNDCAPSFRNDSYVASIVETAEVGSVVVKVHASDNDTGANAELTYTLSIAPGGDNSSLSLFSIDEVSGTVRVVGELDAETATEHRLLVTATDKGRPPLDSTAYLLVKVEDVNDNEPQVERTVISAMVSSEAARGTIVARVAAWDPDRRDEGRLRYRLSTDRPDPAATAFLIEEDSGVVKLQDPAAWGQQRSLSLNVSVSDGAHAVFVRLRLSSAPTNRAAPHFQHLIHEARALENQQPPLLLTTVKAYDEDEGEYGTITYSIPSVKLRDTFNIDPNTGAVYAKIPLDREKRAQWEVGVAATDGGGMRSYSTLRVSVADVNDCPPVFPLAEYRVSPPPSASRIPFIVLTAVDQDAPENARITYSIYESDPTSDAAGLFHIDPHSGAVSFARNATEFAGRTLQIWIRARDSGGLTGEAALAVSVLPARRLAPRLSPPPPALFLPESSPPGTLIASLRSEDDSQEPIKYRLAQGLWPKDLFSIDDDGRLILSGQLDRETAQEHVIGIIAESGYPTLSSMAISRLLVLDVNEHAPTLHATPYVLRLAENTPPHTLLVQLMADDPDSGSNGEVRFSLSEESALFSVDAESGWVRSTTRLDRESKPEHRLQLLASDVGQPRRTTRGTLIIRLQDYNDCPPIFTQDVYVAQVREDAPAGTVVTRIATTDADSGAKGAGYLLVGGDAGGRFTVRAGGDVVVARPLDAEATTHYELRVVATDGKFSAFATVNVTVTDVNDNPPECVSPLTYATISEDAAVGSRVTTLLTTDRDIEYTSPVFYITGENHHHFTMNKETGVVTVAKPLDRESTPKYHLALGGRDVTRAAWRCVTRLVVVVRDVNDNEPKFSADTYSVTLPEDADVGTLIAKVHATDTDLGENGMVRYTFVNEEDSGGVFELSEETGIVRLRAPLDRESKASHTCEIAATDGGKPPKRAKAKLRLSVSDVNDNPPAFELRSYQASVPEIHSPGTNVLQVRAISPDDGVNAEVFYSLVGGDARDDFSIDRNSGLLTIARPLDYERRRDYYLTVQAIDGGTPPLSDLATINITIIDNNDNSPVFTQAAYGARVREDAGIGEHVLQLIADDADDGVNGRVAYSIARGNTDNRFTIDIDTGYLSVAAQLDRETTPAYVLEIRAKDKGVPVLEGTTLVNIEVVDANDNPPLFSQMNYSTVVREDRPLGYTILKLEVNDADAPPNASPYTFDFQAGNEVGAFRLEQDGTLRTATKFNHRIRDRYVLQIRVFDNGTPPLFSDAWIYVKVVEESQYPPVVTPLEIQVISYMDEFPGGVIGKVFASDRDPYDTLTYSLEGYRELFWMEGEGRIVAAARIEAGEYRLNASASDGARSGRAVVVVRVVSVGRGALAAAVAVRWRAMEPEEFIAGARGGLQRAVGEALGGAPGGALGGAPGGAPGGALGGRAGDVLVLSVQPAGDNGNSLDGPRRRRQVAQDLDVLFCVLTPTGYVPAELVRRRLHAEIERLEERTRAVVEELRRPRCQRGCAHCGGRADLGTTIQVISTESFSLAAPTHTLIAECICPPGLTGPRCDQPDNRCEHQDPETCLGEGKSATSTMVQLWGDGYLWYRVETGVVMGSRLLIDDLDIEVKFRTHQTTAILMAVMGRVDYAVLEIVDGHVQFRMELGSGEVSVVAGGAVSDGRWHWVGARRSLGEVRLAVDRRSARAAASPPAALLDVRTDRLLIGAALIKHAHALAPDQVTYGFEGCLAELKLGGVLLPLEEGGTSSDGRAQLVRAVRARSGNCGPLPNPRACHSAPCKNGGTCHDLSDDVTSLSTDDVNITAYTCTCHQRFLGKQCEIDTDPCASQPCLHGGYCTSINSGSFHCACAEGLSGSRCEHGRWCNPQNGTVCLHGGRCEEGEWGASCRCGGYFGPRCQYDVDECAGEPCLNGATCLNEPGSFRCLCPPDKTGMNCGNPLYSDAVMSASNDSPLLATWHWALEAKWPLAAAVAAFLLLLLLALLPLFVRRRAAVVKDEPLNSHAEKITRPRASKLSNLEAERRERPASCLSADPPPLNNLDTLRSYGSAGDELEGIPPDYLRNLNIEPDRKPWSEQMHLQTFVDNKIYNDLKSCKPRPPRTRASPLPPLPPGGGGGGGGAGGGAAYHWDCSDWLGGAALPGITEVPGSERHSDSSHHQRDSDHHTDASSYLLCEEVSSRVSEEPTVGRARSLRDPDAASLITMLEERNSLLGGADAGSCSDLSANLCEIEESEEEEDSRREVKGVTFLERRVTDV